MKNMERLEMKYFVLNPHKDNLFGVASRKAILRYAEIIQHVHPKFATDLRKWIEEVEGGLTQ